MIKLIAGDFTIDAAKGDAPRRTISGTAVPYNVPAVVSDGTAVIFRPGSLPVEGKAPRLFMYHDASMPVGVVTERVDTEQGMMFSAKISATALGNDALVMAMDGTIDQVSVGINPLEFSYDDEGTMVIEKASWQELSLVPIGAFGDMANIATVAASIHQESDEVVLNEEVTPVEEKPEMSEVTAPAVEATIPTAAIPAQPKRQFNLPTPGEYMAAMHIGGTTFENVSAAARDFMRSKQSAFEAAAGDVLTTNTVGLLPVPVLGPVFENLNQSIRPVVAAVGARAYPDGGSQKTFVRPTWTTHTSVAAQSSELSPVSATTPVIASNVVSKTTLSGQVTLSIQDIDFTSPGAMEIIINDLMGQYMQASDNLAADGLVAGATASGQTWSVTANDPSTLISSIYLAAYNILLATNFLPDHIFVAPGVWAALGAQLDAEDRPVFPYVGAAGLMGVNGMGAANITVANTFNPFGLNLVADRNFAAGTMVVARGAAIEYYESIRGLLTRDEPSTLGKVMSYHGYASLFVADATQVQSIIVA
jgi:HK97 family phage prohead protease